MHTKTHHKNGHQNTIAEETHALLAATADIADEKVSEIRNRLTATMAAAKETYEAVQEQTVEGAKAADKVIRSNPYQAIGVAFGVGALVGFLLSRRNK